MLKVEFDSQAGFKALVAAKDIPCGSHLSDMIGDQVVSESRYDTIHIGENKHLVISNEMLYTNHCCRKPNAAFDFKSQPWRLISVKDIRAGQWVTYDYATTEYISGRAFDCQCTSGDCRGRFDGFHALSTEEKCDMIRLDKISPVVLKLHEENNKREGK